LRCDFLKQAIGDRANLCHQRFGGAFEGGMDLVNLFSFETRAEACEALADIMAARLFDVLLDGGTARVALSGGSSPEPCYRALTEHTLDWSRVAVTLVDDRWVGLDSPGSNEAMIRRVFATVPEAQVVGLHVPDISAKAAESELKARLTPLLPLDVVVLGMGPDAHTASWFPGSSDLAAALDPSGHTAIMAYDASDAPVAKPYPERITMTLPVIANAGWIALLLFGADKRDVLTRALEQPSEIAPIRAIFEAAHDRIAVFWAP
jgi:6-phosphogluconolactonase